MTLTTYGDEVIKDYTKNHEIKEPFEFTVGQPNEQDYEFRLMLMVVDENLQFPEDFDKIGTLETFIMDHTLDLDTLA